MTDREMDALVAEKIMGWVWLRHIVRPSSGQGYEWMRSLFIPDHKVEPFEEGTGELGNVPSHGEEPVAIMNAPHYSTDLNAAWQVVEKMQTLSWTFTVSGLRAHIWKAEFMKRTGNVMQDLLSSDSADTAPRAICLAALHAVGVEAK